MWEKFFSGEVAVYASTKVEAARFIKAYMDTGVERLSDEEQAFAAQDNIEFAYNFCGGQIGWAGNAYNGSNRGVHAWIAKFLEQIGRTGVVCAPYTSITVKEFFGDE